MHPACLQFPWASLCLPVPPTIPWASLAPHELPCTSEIPLSFPRFPWPPWPANVPTFGPNQLPRYPHLAPTVASLSRLPYPYWGKSPPFPSRRLSGPLSLGLLGLAPCVCLKCFKRPLGISGVLGVHTSFSCLELPLDFSTIQASIYCFGFWASILHSKFWASNFRGFDFWGLRFYPDFWGFDFAFDFLEFDFASETTS